MTTKVQLDPSKVTAHLYVASSDHPAGLKYGLLPIMTKLRTITNINIHPNKNEYSLNRELFASVGENIVNAITVDKSFCDGLSVDYISKIH